MGFFDSLKKIMNTAEKIGDVVGDIVNSDEQKSESSAKSAQQPTNATAQELIATGNVPAKPSVLLQDEYGDSKLSYKLSGDFVEFNSHCEMYPSYQYEPDNNEDYTDYKENTPQLVCGPFNDAYDAGEEFIKTGTLSGREFSKSDNPCFLFSAKFDYYKEIMYAYVFAEGTERSLDVLAVTYNRDIEGTALEKKLCAALDEVASTYTETKMNEV